MKKKLGLLLGIVILGALYFFNNSQENLSEEDSASLSEVSSAQESKAAHGEGKVSGSDSKPNHNHNKGKGKEEKKAPFDVDGEDEQNFIKIQNKISQIYNKKNSEGELIEYLQKQGLEPQVSRQDNPYTGSMIMIRTKKALPGTRYYHAQYFTDEQGNTFLQHISMEFRPGPGALERARKMIEYTYNVSDGEVARNGDFVKYKPDHDRIIWLKRMDEKDFENEIYNSYDKKEDVGAIRMALELEIHEVGREDADHIHPD